MLPKHCVICLALIAQIVIAVNCDTGLAEEAFVKNMREILDSPQLTDPAHPLHAEISTILHSQKSNLFEEGLNAALLKSNVSLSPQCEADLAVLLEQFYQMWALKFLDAWGKPTPGILLGSLKWTGSYQQCMELTSPVFNQTVGNKTESRSFIGQYCTVVIGSNKGGGGEVPGAGTAADVQLGVCLPDSCSERDIYIIFETVWYTVTKSIATVYSSCQPTKRDTTKLSSAAIGMICVLSILGFLMVLGTAYDIIFYQPSIYRTTQKLQKVNEAGEEKTDPVENGMDDDTHLRVEDYTPIVQDHQNEEIKLKVNKTLEPGFASGFLLCFSITRSGAKILNTTNVSESNLGAIHGIRFFSMTWVILGHVTVFPAQLYRNLAILPDIIKRFSMQAILGATVSVDTFFLLSGVLTTFLCLREMKTRDGPRHINWALYYFHRFWRLTPPYMLVLGTYVALFPYMGSGPFWPTTDINAACSGSWWTNLLYINNLVRTAPQEQCFGWAWFLANDMQFYIISPLMLVPLYFSGIAGTVVTLVLMLASFITTGVISSSNHYLPGMMGAVSPLAQAPDFVNHTQTNSFNDLYIPPYTRIGPYLVGVLLGYLLYKTDRKVKMHWIVVLVGWLIAAVLGMICVYGLWGVVKGTATMSNSVSALYNTVHRSVWGVAVAWVIFACVTGHGGFVNTLLSWQALVPLSRLTYMAYLVHPIVIFANLLQHQESLSYTDFNIVYLFLGNLTLSYMVAFVVSLAFESPMMALEKLVFKRNK